MDSDACDHCISCRKIEGEIHPDVTTLLPENDELKIETIRRAEEILSLRPYEGKKKVLIVDDADKMNISAANAFLKTLEEPPEESIIVLVSASPDRLPDTIRSRCMHVRFRPLSHEAFERVFSMKAPDKNLGPFAGLVMGRPGIGISKDFAKEKKWFMDIYASMMQGETRCAWADKNDIKLWLDLSLILLRDMAVFSITGREDDLLYGEKRPVGDLRPNLRCRPAPSESKDSSRPKSQQINHMELRIGYNTECCWSGSSYSPSNKVGARSMLRPIAVGAKQRSVVLQVAT